MPKRRRESSESAAPSAAAAPLSFGAHIAAQLRASGICVFPLADLGKSYAAQASAALSAATPLLAKACSTAAALEELADMSTAPIELLLGAKTPEGASGLSFFPGYCSAAGAAYVRHARTSFRGWGLNYDVDAALDAAFPGLVGVAESVLQLCADKAAGHILAALIADSASAATSLAVQRLRGGAYMRAHAEASLLSFFVVEARDRVLRVVKGKKRRAAAQLCERLPGCGGAAPEPAELVAVVVPGVLLQRATGIQEACLEYKNAVAGASYEQLSASSGDAHQMLVLRVLPAMTADINVARTCALLAGADDESVAKCGPATVVREAIDGCMRSRGDCW